MFVYMCAQYRAARAAVPGIVVVIAAHFLNECQFMDSVLLCAAVWCGGISTKVLHKNNKIEPNNDLHMCVRVENTNSEVVGGARALWVFI